MNEENQHQEGEDADRADNAPEFILRDGNLRSATWRAEGEYGPLFNTRITKLYRDEDGRPQETSTLGSKDLLRVSELARETHQEIVSRQRDHSQSKRKAPEQSQQRGTRDEWHDEDKTRAEISRERFKEQRQSSRPSRRAPSRDG